MNTFIFAEGMDTVDNRSCFGLISHNKLRVECSQSEIRTFPLGEKDIVDAEQASLIRQVQV